MVITKVLGGLGNQMFQYAAGRALAEKNNTNYKLDIFAFKNYELHQGFELEKIFNCKAEYASKKEIKSILGWQSLPFIRKILRLRKNSNSLRKPGLIIEPHFNYWSEFWSSPSDSYLIGYWQSEKYFHEYESIIRKEFTFKIPLGDRNNVLAEFIKKNNAVSVHIRRGDYVSNPKTAKTHGLCTLEYYHSAIEYIANKVNQPHFFIFSDDPQWVENNFKIGFPCTYINHNLDENSFIDMQLMSMCSHHIVANSSFSWWGAWLGFNPKKIVIAPRQWFAKKMNIDDLIPASWIKI